MAITVTELPPSLHERLTRIWETRPGLLGVLSTVDHKLIGRRYLITAFAFLEIGRAHV